MALAPPEVGGGLDTLERKQATMAGRILNRRELRQQADQAEQQAASAEPDGTATAVPAKKGKAKAKAAAVPKVKKPRIKKKAVVRLCARWGVFDGSMKQVAIFDYNQRAAADQKVADLIAKKNAVHFLQMVKEPMPEPEPVEAPPA
jgi:hypothetical protein